MSPNPSHDASFDALLPAEMAAKAEGVGVKKASMPWLQTLVLGILGGAFIALGAAFSTTVITNGGALPFGVTRLLGGVCFSLGLTLVVVGGAELFTGNALLVMAWASGRLSAPAVLRNWGLVYLGNAIGAMGTAALVVLAEQYRFGGGKVGLTALEIARAKLALGPVSAVALGVLCNALVCLAVWLSLSARTTTDRVIAVMPPVAAFVACGFEHSVANLYFVPAALLVRASAPAEYFASVGSSAEAWADLGWGDFLLHNLLPVTIGNVLGGAVLVAGVYWFLYLRKPRAER